MKIKKPDLAEVGRGAKFALAQTSLMALGATFELASELVPEMQEELKGWDDGRKVAIGVMPAGPYITIQNVGGRIKYLGLGLKDPDLSVLFKNLDSAVLVFATQIGSATAVAENRICVHGSNSHGMGATRAMAIVQTYLFPGIILKKTFKRAPVLDAGHLLIKAKIMAMLVPRLAKIAGR